ncbi:MAG TPA: GNAT family N-acetyltransferase [Burkholderiales bacterium]|nr:GNAT family N-acetyltransferase [Burkholderiales bacterium]
MAQYPGDLERAHRLEDGREVLVRPIRASDEPGERQFFDALSPETRHFRFMRYVRSLNEELLHFFTHVDYERHMAFVCESQGDLVGEARYVREGKACEFSIVIADGWHKTGIAQLLMQALLAHAAASGLETMEGLVLRENRHMLNFVRSLGFEVHPSEEDPALARVTKRLKERVLQTIAP